MTPAPSPPLSPEQQASLTAGASMWATVAIPDAAIPSVAMADGPMGIASGRVDERDVSVLTPSGVALGATWDTGLVARVGALVGGEAKRLGVDLVLAPNLNLPRSPLAGRAFEMFSEDPLLTGVLGAAWIGGLQSRNTGAVAKHVVCNDSETARDRYDATVDEATLREVYMLPFELAADAGCAGLLMAYNGVNCAPCVENRHLITTIIKGDWRFPGLVVSDWFAVKAAVPSAAAGLDLEMPGPARLLGPKLTAAVAGGQVAAARVADAAARVAAAARRWSGSDPVEAPEDREALLREAAAAGFTLLRNDGGLLPFGPELRTIAVIGPNAAAPCYQGGTFAKIALPPGVPTPIEAIRARFAGRRVLFEPGVDPSPRLPPLPVRPARDLGDGSTRGMTVDYIEGLDPAAAPFFTETRDTNSLTWFMGMNEQARFGAPGIVRASGWFTAQRSGTHVFTIGGTGAFSLRVEGVEVLREERAVAPADIMGVLKSGDGVQVAVELAGDVPVEVVAELRFQPARAHGLWYGVRGPDDAAAMMARAVAAARDADAVLLILGETADSGVESKDRETTRLARAQLELAAAVCRANRNVAMVVNVGHAFDPTFADAARALLVAWYPGEAFAPALAETIAGDREPSGRLPVTLARADRDYPVLGLDPEPDGTLPYAEGRLIGYRHFAATGTAPAFPLGAGLGYGAFDYLGAAATRRPDGGIDVKVRIANRAGRASAEVVQVYQMGARFALLGFAKAEVAPGDEREVKVAVPAKALRRWSDAGWVTDDAPVELGIGRSAGDCRLYVALAPD